MNLGQSIRAGIAWLMFGNTGGQIVEFVFGIALARLLLPADFGMIATVQILTGMVSLVTTGGMTQSLVRAKHADEHDFDVVFSLQLTIGIFVCAAIFVVAPWFARFFEDPLYVGLLSVSALNFLLRPFAMIRSAWLTRQMNFKMAAFANLTTTAVTGVSSVAMALGGMGVWSLTFGGLIAALTTNFMLYWLTPLRLRVRFDAQAARQHGSFGLKITALDLLAHFGMEAIKVLMSKLAGPAFLGLYMKGDSLSRMPNSFIHPATNRVLFRALSKVADDPDQSKYLVLRTITLLCVYTFPFLIGLIWLAEPLILILYGEKWLPAAEPARILAIAGFFLSVGRPCSALLHAQNRLNQELVVQCVILLIALPAAFGGLRWGLAGIASVLAMVQIVTVVWFYALASKTIPMRLSDLRRAVAPATLLGTVLVAALAATHWLLGYLRIESTVAYFVTMTGVGGTVYLGVFLLFPVQGIETEAARWRSLAAMAARRLASVVR